VTRQLARGVLTILAPLVGLFLALVLASLASWVVLAPVMAAVKIVERIRGWFAWRRDQKIIEQWELQNPVLADRIRNQTCAPLPGLALTGS
jgi:hypothetical protein